MQAEHKHSSDTVTTVSQLKEIVEQFVGERNWQQYHNPKNLSMAMTVEAGELMEHFQWLTTEQVESHAGYDLEAVSEELSDVVCYALALANTLGIDLSLAISRKMDKNRAKYPASVDDSPASIEKA